MVKKGQMKIQQMAFMLIAVTLFFVLVGLIVLGFVQAGIKERKEQLDELNAKGMIQKLANAPELSCGSSFGTQRTDCVDFDKAMAFKSKNETYSRYWDIGGLEIIKIFPEPNIPLLECTQLNYPDCDILEIFSPKNLGADKSAFINLCRKERFLNSFYTKCEIAKLIVRLPSNE